MIDTVVLGGGVTLWTLGNWHPWQHTWLGAKLVLLVVYVLLGSWALKRAKSRVGKVAFGVLAVTVALHMVGIAAHHHPAGWYAPYFSFARKQCSICAVVLWNHALGREAWLGLSESLPGGCPGV